jgi:hypothetical protein
MQLRVRQKIAHPAAERGAARPEHDNGGAVGQFAWERLT